MDLLLLLYQRGQLLEDYVKDFIELYHQVHWNEATLKTCFWSGLDDYLLQPMPTGDTRCLLRQYIEYALWMTASSLTVKEMEEDGHSTNALPIPATTVHNP